MLLHGSDTPVQARVSRIYPVADASRHTVKVKFDLPVDVIAGPGMYAKVRIPTEEQSHIVARPLIPESAIVRRGSLPSVFVINDQGVAEMRIVRTGARLDDGLITVTSGLAGGERIIDSPPPGIVTGWQPEQGK